MEYTPALSLHMPWLWWITSVGVPSPKRIENRPRRTLAWRNYPNREIYLHASKGGGGRYWGDAVAWVHARFGLSFPVPDPMRVAHGGIVARVRILGMITPEGEIQLEASERLDGALDMRWHMRGSWGYILDDVRLTAFAPCRGYQCFFRPPPDAVNLLEVA